MSTAIVQEQLVVVVVVVSPWCLDLGFYLFPRKFEPFVSLSGIAVELHCHPVVPACELGNLGTWGEREGSTQNGQSSFPIKDLNLIKAALVSWIPFQLEGLQDDLKDIFIVCCQNGLCVKVMKQVQQIQFPR